MKRDVAALAERPWDLIVVGGGIYGVCAAREAALQGLAVCLLERDDFGGATSANSLKIMHGGLRYLQNLDFKRMRESIGERRTLGRLAPHLVRPMPFAIPCYGHLLRGREVMGVALLMNDLISADRNRGLLPERRLPRGRLLSKRRTEELIPDLPEPGLVGGAIWYDGQARNTERLTLAFLQAAVAAGAAAANHAAVEGFLEGEGRVEGVVVRDAETGAAHRVRGRVVLNAAGPWVDALLGRLASARPARHFHMSKGMNLVTRRVFPDHDLGVAIPYQEGYEDKQAVLDKGKLHFFVVPWKGYSLIGTRHLPWDGDPDAFRVTEADVSRFLGEIGRAYPAANLRREDVLKVYEGMLPALAGAGGDGGDGADVQIGKQYTITDHAETDGLDGLVTLLGVKWTTARDVAERAVATVLGKLGRPARCDSARVPLPAGAIDDWGALLRAVRERAPREWSDALVEGVAERHGAAAPAVAARANARPEWARVVEGGAPAAGVEFDVAGRDEMAVRLADAVFRRTEIAIAGDPGAASIEEAAARMAEARGWDDGRRAREIDTVREALRRDAVPGGPARV